MAFITQVGTNTVTNTNLTTATLVCTFTNTTRIRKLWVNVFADQVKGGGDYVAFVTIQRAGSGSFYESIKTTKTAGAGITSIYFGSIAVTLNATDVMKIYLTGLATDNDTTADVIVDVNEEWKDVDASGKVLLQPTQSGVTIPTVTTLTNAPSDSAGVTTLLSGLVPTSGSVNDTGATTTAFITTLASAVNDYYKGEAVVFTSGALIGQLGQIKQYVGATKQVILQSALTSAPVNGVTFVIATVAASRKLADFIAALGSDFKPILSADAQTGVTIPTVTTLTNAPPNSAGITTILTDYARRTGDYATVTALATLQGNVTTILADYARRTGDYATVAAISAALSAAHGSGLWGGVAGSGSVEFVYTLTETLGGSPIGQASVWATTDAAGTNIVASGETDNFGQVTFYLDSGTYYIWSVKAGYNFSNPDQETIV